MPPTGCHPHSAANSAVGLPRVSRLFRDVLRIDSLENHEKPSRSDASLIFISDFMTFAITTKRALSFLLIVK